MSSDGYGTSAEDRGQGENNVDRKKVVTRVEAIFVGCWCYPRWMDFEIVLKRLASNLKKARWLRGLTQQEVAMMGVNLRYYQELERGLRNPSFRMLHELAQVLGVRVVDLVEVGEATEPIDLARADATPPRRGRKRIKNSMRRAP